MVLIHLLIFYLTHLQISAATTIIDESSYTDCNLSLSTDYDAQLWQQKSISTGQVVEFLDCINTCSNKSDEVYYVLGLFDSDDLLRRKIEIPFSHQHLYFTITLFQVDRWNIPESFVITIDGISAYTWAFSGPVTDSSKRDYCGSSGSLAVEQDQIITATFDVAHSTNIVEIAIYTTISGKGQWAISTFTMTADPCVTGACLTGSAVTFSLSTLDTVQQIGDIYRLTAKIIFNQSIFFLNSTTVYDRVKASISGGLSSNLYNIIMQVSSSTDILIYIDLETSIRDRSLEIYFPQPEYVRSTAENFTIIADYSDTIGLTTVYYVDSSTESISATIASIIKYIGIALTVSLIPLIILRQFDVVAYTYFAHQMIYYYGSINIRMPENVITVFKSFDVFSFSFLPNLFSSLVDTSVYSTLVGFDTIPLFLHNAGYLFTPLIGIITIHSICKIFTTKIFNRLPRAQSFMRRLISHVFEWNVFIQFAMLCVMHVLYSFFIQFLSFSEIAVNGISVLSLGVSFISVIALVGFLVYVSRVMIKLRVDITDQAIDPEIERRYGQLWSKCERNNFWIQTCFYVQLMLRRVIFIFTVSFFSDYVYTQFNIMNILSIVVLYEIIIFKPFTEQRFNKRVLWTEVLLFAVQTIAQNLRSDDSEDESSRIRMGWYLIFMISIIVILHCGFIANDIIRYAKLWFVFQSEQAAEYRRILDEKLAPPLPQVKPKVDETKKQVANPELKSPPKPVTSNPVTVPFIQGLSESFDNAGLPTANALGSPRSRRQSLPEVSSPRNATSTLSPTKQFGASKFRPTIVRDQKANYDTVFQRQPTKQVSFVSSVPSITKDEGQVESRILGTYIHSNNKNTAPMSSGINDSNHSLGKYIDNKEPALRRKRTDIQPISGKLDEEQVNSNHSLGKYIEKNKEPAFRRKRTDIHPLSVKDEDDGKDSDTSIAKSTRRRTIIQTTKLTSEGDYIPSAIDSTDNLRRRRNVVGQSQSSIRADSAVDEESQQPPDEFDFKGFRQKRQDTNLNHSTSNASLKAPGEEVTATDEPDNFDFKGFRQKRTSAYQRQNSNSVSGVVETNNLPTSEPDDFNFKGFRQKRTSAYQRQPSNSVKGDENATEPDDFNFKGFRQKRQSAFMRQSSISSQDGPNLFNPFEFKSSNTLKARQRINKDSPLTSLIQTENSSPEKQQQQNGKQDRRKRIGIQSQTSIRSVESNDQKNESIAGQRKRVRNNPTAFNEEIDVPMRNRNASIEGILKKQEEEAAGNPAVQELEKKKKKKKTKGVRVDALQIQNILSN